MIKALFDQDFSISIKYGKDKRSFVMSLTRSDGSVSDGLKFMTLPELATVYASITSLVPEVVKKAQSARDIENLLDTIKG